MPQLDQLTLVYLSQWFWLALVLATIFVVVGLWIVPRVESTVDDRDARIAADLAEAQRLQDEAEAAEASWRERMNAAHAEAQGKTAEAKAAAALKAEARVGSASEAINAQIEKAEAELAKARSAALAEVEGVAAEAAQDIVAKLTGASVDAAKARSAVAGALANA